MNDNISTNAETRNFARRSVKHAHGEDLHNEHVNSKLMHSYD